MLTNDDAPTCRILSERQVRARKQYVCEYCKKPIMAGTKHWRVAMIYDDNFEFYRSHTPTQLMCWGEET
jgi:hypothetical protein